MTTEILVALFGGTGIATTVSVLYQIWRERKSNVQKDLAGDLTLGELFRQEARKDILEVYREKDELRKRLKECRDELARVRGERQDRA